MSPLVFDAFASIAKRLYSAKSPEAVLEIGAGGWTLLSIPNFVLSQRVALNLRFDTVTEQLQQTRRVIGNSNEMEFPDESFDCVMSCSAMEHDKYFWRTVSEAKRVLKHGGVFIVGVPIYMTLPSDINFTTVTYARHGLSYNADFYRFSEQAVREVFFEGYSEVTDEVIVRRDPNPYLVAAARK